MTSTEAAAEESTIADESPAKYRKVGTLKGELITETNAKKKYELSRGEITQALRSGELEFMERAFMGTRYLKMREEDVRALVERLYPGRLAQADSAAEQAARKKGVGALKKEIRELEQQLAAKRKALLALQNELGLNTPKSRKRKAGEAESTDSGKKDDKTPPLTKVRR